MSGDSGSGRGMGLLSMRERAELMGGELRVERPDAGGVRIRVRIPVAIAAASSDRTLQGAPEVA
jgi:protein-histidine pros-kinase